MKISGSASRPPDHRKRWPRISGVAIIAALALISFCNCVQTQELDDNGAAKSAATLPNIYVDLRTTYATVPANTLSIGLGNSSFSSVVSTLRSLATLTNGGATSALSRLLPLSSHSISVDVPLTVDVTDRLSIYGGISGSASQAGIADRSDFAISSWMAGFQADVYKQNGGSIPTVTLQSTLTRSIPDSPLATTSLSMIVEFGYALNEDETRGLLAGAQYTRVGFDTPLARISPAVVGYIGGYYQWDNNWKFTGRVGVQSFGGAQLLNLMPISSFTQPIVRLDLDCNDGNDNRLFGVTAQVAWVPKPAFTLTFRTPLYGVRHP